MWDKLVWAWCRWCEDFTCSHSLSSLCSLCSPLCVCVCLPQCLSLSASVSVSVCLPLSLSVPPLLSQFPMDFFRPLAQSISRRPLPPPFPIPLPPLSLIPNSAFPTPSFFSVNPPLFVSLPLNLSFSPPPPPTPYPTFPPSESSPLSHNPHSVSQPPPPPPVNVLYPWHYQVRRFSPLPTEPLTSETVSILATNATITFQGRSFSNYQGALESVLKEKRRRNIDRDGENACCSMMMKSQCTFPSSRWMSIKENTRNADFILFYWKDESSRPLKETCFFSSVSKSISDETTETTRRTLIGT